MTDPLLNNQKQTAGFADTIRTVVSKYTMIPEDDIGIKTRKREIVQARQLCMYFAKWMTSMSLTSIGETYGDKDHATVLHACRTVENLRETDRKYRGMHYNIQEDLDKLAVNTYDDTLVCILCGQAKIQTKAWVDPNSNTVIEKFNIEENSPLDNWCEDCEAGVPLITRKKYNEAQEELELKKTDKALGF